MLLSSSTGLEHPQLRLENLLDRICMLHDTIDGWRVRGREMPAGGAPGWLWLPQLLAAEEGWLAAHCHCHCVSLLWLILSLFRPMLRLVVTGSVGLIEYCSKTHLSNDIQTPSFLGRSLPVASNGRIMLSLHVMVGAAAYVSFVRPWTDFKSITLWLGKNGMTHELWWENDMYNGPQSTLHEAWESIRCSWVIFLWRVIDPTLSSELLSLTA